MHQADDSENRDGYQSGSAARKMALWAAAAIAIIAVSLASLVSVYTEYWPR